MAAATPYDSVLYPSLPFQQTHPARIAAIARLHGVDAPSPTKCRVLELGGGDGTNIIPMAQSYPDSEFLGLDLAPTPVAAGNEQIAALGLTNIRLEAADIMTAGPELGKFDYILLHGVFSWVPDFVREKILQLCDELLTPNGVAYISYNALPGCHVRRIYWDYLRFHTRKIDDPKDKLQQARAALAFMAQGVNIEGSLGNYIREEAVHMSDDRHEAVLYHDDLSDNNTPFYFHEFAHRAAKNNLQFLAEADYHDMNLSGFAPEIADRLEDLSVSDPVLMQQYRDYLRVRRFRQTLLVKTDANVNRVPDRGRVREFQTATLIRLTPKNPDLTGGVTVSFQGKNDAGLTTNHPWAKAVLAELTDRWPHPRGFDAIVAGAEKKLNLPADAEALQVIEDTLFAGAIGGLLQLFVDPPAVVGVSELPRVSPLVRQQIAGGRTILSNVMHIPVKVDEPLTRQLLWFMDGTRTPPQIADALADWAVAEAAAHPDRGAAPPREELHALYTGQMAAGVATAAELGLLVP